MSKVITFSRFFPIYHPKKREPTYFVEKINKSLGFSYGIPFGDLTEKHFADLGIEYSHKIYCDVSPKYHTIRSGNRWKVGEKFSPRVWSGKPYNSKQVIIAPDILIEKVWDFEIRSGSFYINGKEYTGITEDDYELLEVIAKNDGLDRHDLMKWFKYPNPFKGQIICWSKNIKY